MSQFMVAPRSLEHAREQLLAMRLGGTKEVSRLTALAECNFRLAVHPDTPTEQAIPLLEEAVRLDGANPKYAYHLGRMHFGAGRLAAAARWLRLACCLAPTSHRIWAHVAVLLQELNDVYHGDTDFEPNVLQQRAEKISAAIQQGNDQIDPELLDFVPPKSRAVQEQEARQGHLSKTSAATDSSREQQPRPRGDLKRYLHARKCRWWGVDHLLIERVLRGRPTQANVRLMMPVLQRVAATGNGRPGGPAATAILLVQWLVAGYPVATVRRLMQTLPPELPSHRLLETVCHLCEAPADALPALLAAAVDRGEVPLLLAALIHRQRLLWYSLEFRSLGVYRAARTMLAATRAAANGSAAESAATAQRDEAIQELIRKLDLARSALEGKPPKTLDDVIPKPRQQAAPAGPAALLARFVAFEAASHKLIMLKDEAFALLKDQLEPRAAQTADADALAQACADLAAAEQFVAQFPQALQTCTAQFQMVVDALGALDQAGLPDDFVSRREECGARFQSVGNFGKFKVLKRIEKRLREAGAAAADRPPDAAWSALLAGLVAVVPGESDPAVTDAAADPSDACDQTQLLVQEAERLLQQTQEDWRFLQSCEERHPEPGLAPADLEQLHDLRSRFPVAVQQAEEQTRAIGQRRSAGNNSLEDIERLETAEKQYQQVLKVIGKFQKKLMRLPTEHAQPAEEAAPTMPEFDTSPQPPAAPNQPPPTPDDAFFADILADNAAADSSSDQPGDAAAAPPAMEGNGQPLSPAEEPQAKATQPAVPAEASTPSGKLRQTLLQVDQDIEQLFTSHLATLEQYPQWIQASPPFECLRRRLLAQKAETFYRLGHRQKARVIWNGLLRINRLDAAALKNIAVCDTAQQDVSRSLTSWSEYLELLYLFDVFSGNPADHAGPRAEFHRAFGSAYAPAFMSAPANHEWADQVDPAALIAFLSSPARFRAFIDHRLLEYLNTRFQFTCPTLVLGIKRVECDGYLEQAEQTITAYVRQIGQSIPGRGATRFTQLAVQAIEKAAGQCRKVSRLTLQAMPNYDQEEKTQIELLARMFDLKLKLAQAFAQHVNMVKNIGSLEFLKEIDQLDAIPLKLSPGLLPLVAMTMGLDVETLADLSQTLRLNVIISLLKYLLADDDPAERSTRLRQYELLTGDWLRLPEFREYARMVDSPSPSFMPREVAERLQQGQVEAVLPQLRKWHDDYPAFASLAVWISNCLFKQQAFEEAQQRLTTSLEVAFYEPTRRHIQYLLVQILLRKMKEHIDDENYGAALALNIEMIRLDDYQAALVMQALQLCVGGGQFTYRAELVEAIQDWLQRATALAGKELPEEESIPYPSLDDLEQVRAACQQHQDQWPELAALFGPDEA